MNPSGGRGCCAPSGADAPLLPDVPRQAAGPDAASVDFRSIPAGRYRIGYEGPLAHPADGEGPEREVTVPAFRMGSTAVTNAQFAAFVEATGYVTDAQRSGSSFVFHLLLDEPSRLAAPTPPGLPWWRLVPGACWSAPEGPVTDVMARLDHPVVHVSYRDAAAYARWRGARLPTEVEWEIAARGGLAGALYPWGNELTPGAQWLCNIWQGSFPDANSREDGYLGTAPVRSFPPNAYGLYETCGNVWEWVSGSWSGRDHACVRRGGSYLCHDSYCNRYRVSARARGLPADTAGNVGFRVARD
jgi:sulfatase modifying factor 1